MLKLEWNVPDPCSFATCFPPHPQTSQATPDQRLETAGTVGRAPSLGWTDLSFVNLGVLELSES